MRIFLVMLLLWAALVTAMDGWKYIGFVPSTWSQMNKVLERGAR